MNWPITPLNEQEVAGVLDKSVSTLQKMRSARVGPPWMKDGNTIVLVAVEIEKDDRPPVIYNLTIVHHWDDTVEATVNDVQDDPRSRDEVRRTFARLASKWLTPADMHALLLSMVDARMSGDGGTDLQALAAACEAYEAIMFPIGPPPDMTTATLRHPEPAVERVAQAMATHCMEVWADLDEAERERWRDEARAALAAAREV